MKIMYDYPILSVIKDVSHYLYTNNRSVTIGLIATNISHVFSLIVSFTLYNRCANLVWKVITCLGASQNGGDITYFEPEKMYAISKNHISLM